LQKELQCRGGSAPITYWEFDYLLTKGTAEKKNVVFIYGWYKLLHAFNVNCGLLDKNKKPLAFYDKGTLAYLAMYCRRIKLEKELAALSDGDEDRRTKLEKEIAHPKKVLEMYRELNQLERKVAEMQPRINCEIIRDAKIKEIKLEESMKITEDLRQLQSMIELEEKYAKIGQSGWCQPKEDRHQLEADKEAAKVKLQKINAEHNKKLESDLNERTRLENEIAKLRVKIFKDDL